MQLVPTRCRIPFSVTLACLGLGAVSSAGLAQTLQNDTVELTVAANAGHLGAVSVQNRTSGERLQLPEAFVLRLQDGRTLAASSMDLSSTPAVTRIEAEASSSRAAEHLTGQRLCRDLHDSSVGADVRWCVVLRDRTDYVRQEITIHAGAQPLPLSDVQLLAFHSDGARVAGSVAGSPVVTGNIYGGFEHPLSYSTATSGDVVCGLKRTLPLGAGQSISYSSVIGFAHPGQMRRDFLSYIELERAHPYRPFLHYNTWYDLGDGNRYDAAGVEDRMHAFGEELVRKRGVTMDSFLMDDGWDDTHSLWKFDRGFPDGFAPLKSTAEQYGFGIGVWMSPWGGYNEAKQDRIAYGRQHDYEIVDNGYALSGPRYYKAFEETALNFIRNAGVNQFKIDGTGNVNSVFPNSIFDSDFSAAIHFIETLRQADPNVFMNVSTGTKPSPFWLRYADCVWRSGEDHDFDGEGSWRQRWITYRDEQTYRGIVQKGPLFPLNSLMLHGIIYAQKTDHLGTDPNHDFSDEVRSYFGTGTQLQEMYITPSLLSQSDWDVLAEAARWSRANASTLRDTHWVGGDPGKGEVYGWASWTPEKAILTLRNPSAKASSIAIDARQAFELPRGAAQSYVAHSPWKADADKPAVRLSAGEPHTFALAPFQVITLEAQPQR